MKSLEEISYTIVSDPHFRKRFLTGSILNMVPILNLVPLGYLLRYSRQTQKFKDCRYPAWDDIQGMFNDGIIFLVILVVYSGVPLLAAFLLCLLCKWAFAALGMGLIGVLLGLMFYGLALFAGPLATVAALYRYQADRKLGDGLEIKAVGRLVKSRLPQLSLASCLYNGLVLLFLPLYGFTFFLGYSILIAYSNALFKEDNLHMQAAKADTQAKDTAVNRKPGKEDEPEVPPESDTDAGTGDSRP